MMTRLLDQQTVRRRRSSRSSARPIRHDSVLEGQDSPRITEAFRRRLGSLVRVGLLTVVVAGLAAGLMIVGRNGSAAEALGSTVVPDDLERAALNLPGPAPGVSPGVGDTPPEVSFERTEDSEYIVAAGDTLSSIGRQFGLSYSELAGYNRLENPNRLAPGQVIVIPSTDALSNRVQ